MLAYIILFSLLGSVFSMIGGVLLLWKANFAKKISLFLISFAAGVLLGVAFLDLLPEGFEAIGDIHTVSIVVLITIATLFTIERFLWWFHHHRFQSAEHHDEHKEHLVHKTHAYLLLAGDALHNFIDGVVIAASFMIDIKLGIGVSLGIIAHELPQEIADFSIMITAGFDKMKTFLLNLLAASTTLIGALVAYYTLLRVEGLVPYLLIVGMGVFIYIALSDLIPAIHHHSEHKHDALHFLFFASGIMLIFLLGIITPGHGHSDEASHAHEDEIHHEEGLIHEEEHYEDEHHEDEHEHMEEELHGH